MTRLSCCRWSAAAFVVCLILFTSVCRADDYYDDSDQYYDEYMEYVETAAKSFMNYLEATEAPTVQIPVVDDAGTTPQAEPAVTTQKATKTTNTTATTPEPTTAMTLTTTTKALTTTTKALTTTTKALTTTTKALTTTTKALATTTKGSITSDNSDYSDSFGVDYTDYGYDEYMEYMETAAKSFMIYLETTENPVVDDIITVPQAEPTERALVEATTTTTQPITTETTTTKSSTRASTTTKPASTESTTTTTAPTTTESTTTITTTTTKKPATTTKPTTTTAEATTTVYEYQDYLDAFDADYGYDEYMEALKLFKTGANAQSESAETTRKPTTTVKTTTTTTPTRTTTKSPSTTKPTIATTEATTVYDYRENLNAFDADYGFEEFMENKGYTDEATTSESDLVQKSTTTVKTITEPTSAKLTTTTANRLYGLKDIWNAFGLGDEDAEEASFEGDSIQEMLDAILRIINQGESDTTTTTTITDATQTPSTTVKTSKTTAEPTATVYNYQEKLDAFDADYGFEEFMANAERTDETTLSQSEIAATSPKLTTSKKTTVPTESRTAANEPLTTTKEPETFTYAFYGFESENLDDNEEETYKFTTYQLATTETTSRLTTTTTKFSEDSKTTEETRESFEEPALAATTAPDMSLNALFIIGGLSLAVGLGYFLGTVFIRSPL